MTELAYMSSVVDDVVEQHVSGSGAADKITVRLFSQKINRRGNIVEVAGMKTGNFRSNPVLLLEHGKGNSGLPIGVVRNLQRNDGDMTAELAFDVDDPMAAAVKGKFDRGVLKTVSIGFIPQKYELIDPDDVPWGPIRITQGELVEVSVVATPLDSTARRIQSMATTANVSATEIVDTLVSLI